MYRVGVTSKRIVFKNIRFDCFSEKDSLFELIYVFLVELIVVVQTVGGNATKSIFVLQT